MKNLDIVYSDAQYFDASDDRWDLPDFKLYDFLHCNCIYVTAIIRKSTFDRVGGFDTSLTHFEDWNLFISIIKNREKDEVIVKMSEVLFFYRKRSDNLSITNRANNKKLSDNVLKMYNNHYDFYIENGIYFDQMLFRDFLKIQTGCKTNKNWLNGLRYYLFKRQKYNQLYGKS